MKTLESIYTSKDGLALFARRWEPDTEPDAAICLIHGLGEHCGRYTHVAQALTGAGFAVLSFDLRGHGKSAGPRGHTPSSDAFVEDIDLLLQDAHRLFPGKPLFLYGHSLGGILVLYYSLRRKPHLAGIATSPGLRTSLEEQPAKIITAKILGNLLPTMSLHTGLNPDEISHDPQVVQLYRTDPLVHDVASLGFAKNLLKAIAWTFAHASEFNPPLLLVHGTADRLAYPRGSEEFAQLVRGDCTQILAGPVTRTHNEPKGAGFGLYDCLVAEQDSNSHTGLRLAGQHTPPASLKYLNSPNCPGQSTPLVGKSCGTYRIRRRSFLRIGVMS
jgi:alpha-beta hydrolase superfamily lysophospholipase